MTQEDCALNITIKRKKYDVETGRGYIELEIDGEIHKFKVHHTPKRKGFIIEYRGVYIPLSKLKKLLKQNGLEKYAEHIELCIRSMIYEAQVKTTRKHKIIIMKNVRINNSQLIKIGIRDDGKVVLRFGVKKVLAEKSNIKEKLAELLPMDIMSPELVERVKNALTSIWQSIIPGTEVVVLLDGEAKDMILPTAVVNDKLVLTIPFVATYLDADDLKRGLLALVIIVDSSGKVERLDQLLNPVTIEIDGKTIYKDFLERISSSEALERILPNTELIKKFRDVIETVHDIAWSKALESIEKLIDKYAYVVGRNKTVAILYAVAQSFYDLIPFFPILRVIGEMGSGKRQLANVIATCSLFALTVVKPTEAALYRLVDAFHPVLVIDESRISDDIALLLNAGFEKDKFIPRTRSTEKGKMTIDVFNFYSPKVIVSRPGRLVLPDDTISRTLEVYMQRITNEVFPLEIDPIDREETVTTLLLLKIRRWKEFVETYNMLRNELVGIDPRTRDTYLPLITVAYLASKEENNPSRFVEILEDMVKTAEERAGTAYHQKLAIIGILKYMASNSILGGKVKLVSISVKDIERALSMKFDNNVKIRIGRFLNEAPFKASKSRSGGYTKYLIDVERLYHYATSYNIDLSMLSDDELDKLEKVTSLSWRTAGFNRDVWVKNVVGKFFGENSPESPQPPSTPSTPSQQDRKPGGGSDNHNVRGMISSAPTRCNANSEAQ